MKLSNKWVLRNCLDKSARSLHEFLKFDNFDSFHFFTQNRDVARLQYLKNHMKFENDPMSSLRETTWTMTDMRQTDRHISLRYMGDDNVP